MPTRPPRILTVRLVAVALVAGVVLAVVNVPVAAVVGGLPLAGAASRKWEGHFFLDGQFVIFERWRNPASERWSIFSGPHEMGGHVLAVWGSTSTTPLTRDPLPPRARPPRDGQVRSGQYRSAGWPWRSAGGSQGEAPAGVWRARALSRFYWIPFLPHWPGLLANTIFYALLVLTPVVLWRWWRLRRRLKHGRCAACGYDLGGSDGVCPECGLAATHRS